MHYDFTPYNYVLNNPINYFDVMGLETARASGMTPADWHKFNPQSDVLQADEVTINGNKKSESSANQSADDILNQQMFMRIASFKRQPYDISTINGDIGRTWVTRSAVPTRWGFKLVNIGSTQAQIKANLKRGDLLVLVRIKQVIGQTYIMQ